MFVWVFDRFIRKGLGDQILSVECENLSFELVGINVSFNIHKNKISSIIYETTIDNDIT